MTKEVELKFHEIREVDNSLFKYVVVASKYMDKWIFCKNRNRKWELPGGHVENEETPLEAAKRELLEETGAIKFEITPICAYSINNFGVLFYAEIEELGDLPESEIERIDFFQDIPNELSFPLFHPKHLSKVKSVLGGIGNG